MKKDSIAILLILVAYLALVWGADFSFPTPWIDEFHFLAPARAWADHWTLFAPEIHPDRALMWMPPGYSLLIGTLFKIFGSSLGMARAFSMACMGGALGILLRWVNRHESRWVAFFLLGWTWLSANAILAGNVARMEAPFLLLILSGVEAFRRRHWSWGLLALGLSPLLHPNGSYFALAGAAWVVFVEKPSRRSLRSRAVLLPLGILALAVLSYASYVGLHWEAFQADMAYQFARKAARRVFGGSAWLRFLPEFACVLGLIGLSAFRRSRENLLLAGFGGVCFFVQFVGHEIWYDFFGQLWHAVFWILLIEWLWKQGSRLGKACGVLMALLWAFGVPKFSGLASPVGYPTSLRTADFSYPTLSERIWLRSSESAELLSKLKARIIEKDPTAQPVRIETEDGAGILFWRDTPNEIQWVAPMFGALQVNYRLTWRERSCQGEPLLRTARQLWCLRERP